MRRLEGEFEENELHKLAAAEARRRQRAPWSRAWTRMNTWEELEKLELLGGRERKLERARERDFELRPRAGENWRGQEREKLSDPLSLDNWRG
jgi:hypothetical protein